MRAKCKIRNIQWIFKRWIFIFISERIPTTLNGRLEWISTYINCLIFSKNFSWNVLCLSLCLIKHFVIFSIKLKFGYGMVWRVYIFYMVCIRKLHQKQDVSPKRTFLILYFSFINSKYLPLWSGCFGRIRIRFFYNEVGSRSGFQIMAKSGSGFHNLVGAVLFGSWIRIWIWVHPDPKPC